MRVTRVVGISLVSWLVVAAAVERESAIAALSGMLGPLAIVVASWLLTVHAHQRNPGRVTSVMVAAFGAKMVFIGAYVMVMLGVLSLRPVPFIASFTIYFVALYLIEALYLRRLFAGGLDTPR